MATVAEQIRFLTRMVRQNESDQDRIIAAQWSAYSAEVLNCAEARRLAYLEELEQLRCQYLEELEQLRCQPVR